MNFRDILLRIISFGLLSEAKENSYIHYKFISNQENLQSILNNNKALIAISGHPSKPVLIDEYIYIQILFPYYILQSLSQQQHGHVPL